MPARQRAQDRHHTDDTETLANKQIIQAWIAEARAEIEAARLLVMRTAWRIDQAEHHGRDGFYDAQIDVSLIKFHVAGVMLRAVDRAVQVHGALGLTSDTVLRTSTATNAGPASTTAPTRFHGGRGSPPDETARQPLEAVPSGKSVDSHGRLRTLPIHSNTFPDSLVVTPV